MTILSKKLGRSYSYHQFSSSVLVYFGRSRPPEVKVEESLKGKASPTLDNLQKAYSSEANSNVMYLNFAKKAREEGYKDVALLFKILADAEQIHRDNHARVIKAMGTTPIKATIAPQAVSTIEHKANFTTSNLDELLKGNLSSSVNGESNERQMGSSICQTGSLTII